MSPGFSQPPLWNVCVKVTETLPARTTNIVAIIDVFTGTVQDGLPGTCAVPERSAVLDGCSKGIVDAVGDTCVDVAPKSGPSMSSTVITGEETLSCQIRRLPPSSEEFRSCRRIRLG